MQKTTKYQFTVKDALIVLRKYKAKTPLTREILEEIQKESLANRIEQTRTHILRKAKK